MLTHPLKSTIDALRKEDGFTLVELLVVMVAGMIVVSALLTIFDVTLHQTTRTFSRVDATQRARTTLEGIENQLHSSCVGGGTTPIQAGSTGTSLTFLSQYGAATTPTPVEHVISFSSSSGTLTDTTYASTGGSAPNWIFSSTASGTNALLANVAQSGTTPVFQYFAYTEPKDSSGNPYQDLGGNPYEMLLDGTSTLPSGATTSGGGSVAPGTFPANSFSPLATPLSAADAQNAAEVMITLTVGPRAGPGSLTNSSLGIGTVTDSVVLRLTPVANHESANQNVSPCA